MKDFIKVGFIYLIAGALGGVFFREFTKFMGFSGVTALSYIHPHLIGLGTLVFLVLALFRNIKDFTQDKKYKMFFMTYNAGLIGMNVMFFVRGIMQVLNVALSSGMNGAISGIAGLFHIIFFAGIYRLVSLLKNNFD
ncbi:MAG: DUF2871 domain-containing protein [Erysipelotrichaceae bacterium]|nr:DUF2871 domain-containing protein [Erysipelotrichaceae bacterium]